MRIRPFREQDAVKIISWVKNERTNHLWCVNRIPFLESGLQEQDFINRIHKEEAEEDVSAFCAVEDDGTLIGFFCIRMEYDNNVGFMKYIIVNDEMRGKGYGTSMVTLAVKYIKQIMRFEAARLSVFDVNEQAKRAYEKAGFQEYSYTRESYLFGGEKWGRYILEER